MGACTVRTNVSISASWWAVFPIVEISAYKMRDVALLRGRVETMRPCTGPTGMPYLEAGGIIGGIGRVRIALGCRITKIKSERRKISV